MSKALRFQFMFEVPSPAALKNAAEHCGVLNMKLSKESFPISQMVVDPTTAMQVTIKVGGWDQKDVIIKEVDFLSADENECRIWFDIIKREGDEEKLSIIKYEGFCSTITRTGFLWRYAS